MKRELLKRGFPLLEIPRLQAREDVIRWRTAGLGLPTVLVQEGGYLSDDLGRNLVQFLSGFEKGW